MVAIKRWFFHTFMPPWRWRLAFPAAVLKDIEMAVKQSERRHRGELRFAVENALAPAWVWRGTSARQRATEVFFKFTGVDTEENSGVLIYLLWPTEKFISLLIAALPDVCRRLSGMQ